MPVPVLVQVSGPVLVVPYDPEWPVVFDALRRVYLSALGQLAVAVEHVGSTMTFSRDGAVDVPRDGSGRERASHNTYVCAANAEELRRHIMFRDWRRRNPRVADEYGRLKQRLAATYRDDRDSYTEAKSDFVEATLTAAVQIAPVGAA